MDWIAFSICYSLCRILLQCLWQNPISRLLDVFVFSFRLLDFYSAVIFCSSLLGPMTGPVIDYHVYHSLGAKISMSLLI